MLIGKSSPKFESLFERSTLSAIGNANPGNPKHGLPAFLSNPKPGFEKTRLYSNPIKPGFTGNKTRVFKNIFNNNFRCKSHKTNYI